MFAYLLIYFNPHGLFQQIRQRRRTRRPTCHGWQEEAKRAVPVAQQAGAVEARRRGRGDLGALARGSAFTPRRALGRAAHEHRDGRERLQEPKHGRESVRREVSVGPTLRVEHAQSGAEPGLLYEYSRQARGHQNGWLRVIPNFATTYN